MKKFFKILTMLTTAALLAGVTACSNDDTEYDPGKLPDGDNIYFGQELNKTVVKIAKDVNEHTVFVRRAKAGEAYTVKLKVETGTSALLTVPATAKFEAGALEASIKITYDFTKMQADSKYAVELTLDDKQTTPFGESAVKFSLAYIPEIEWETDASGNQKTLTAVVSESVFTGKHTVKILKQKGKNYYRIERVMYQIWQEDPAAESDFGECENISFSLTDKYEPIKPETFTCDFGYNEPTLGRLGFFFGNEGYNPEYFSFVRSGYTYTLNGFYTSNGEIWNLMVFKIQITNNPFDEKWAERFVTDYNKAYTYEMIPGIGEFTSKAFPEDDGTPAVWEQSIGYAENDEGATIYYLPDLYAEKFGLAVVYTPGENDGDEAMLSIPDNQPTGIKMFGNDVYMSRGRVVPLELIFDKDGNPEHATLPIKLHLKDGTALGEFAEEFDFQFVPAGDVTPFLGTYTVTAKNTENASYAPFNVTIAEFDTDVSGILDQPNAVKVSGLVPAEFMSFFKVTDQGFIPAFFDPLRNRLNLDMDLLYSDETFKNVFTWSFTSKDGVIEFIPGIRPADYNGKGEMVNTAYLVRDENTGALSLTGADSYALIMFKPDMSDLIGNFDFVMEPAFTPVASFRASAFLPAIKTLPHAVKQLKNEKKLVRKAAFKHIDASHLKVTPEIMPTRSPITNLQKHVL